MNDCSLEMRTTVHAPVNRVWNALTQPEQIRQYFFGTNTHTNWEPGSPVIFEGEWEGKKYRDKGTVLDFVPKKLIKYSYWSSLSGIEDKPENYVVITYELEEDGNDTGLIVRQENIPDEKMKTHAAGNWAKVLKGLKELVETAEITK